MKFVFLEFYLRDAMFSNARSTFFQRHEICVSTPKRGAHEVRVFEASPHRRKVRVSSQGHETRVFVPKHEVRVSSPRRETHVLKREGLVSSAENEPHVSNSKREPYVFETCVSKLRHKTHVHSLTAKVRTEPGSPHPQRLEAGLFDPSTTDLRDYLTKKRSVYQITPQCCCEWLITAVLSECHCNSHLSKQSVFNRLSTTPVSCSAKRHRSRKKRTFSDTEYPKVTANMVGPRPRQTRLRGSS